MSERIYDIQISSDGREIVSINDFRLPEGSLTLLFGESGIGKSMTALAIAGLLDPDEFDIHIDGKPYEPYLTSDEAINIRRNGFFVFQEPSSHLNPLLTVRTQIREGSLANVTDEGKIFGRLWGGGTLTPENILDVYPKPFRPSGGEKQRVLASMAFKQMSRIETGTQSGLFIFDEPTGNLDNGLRDQFLDLLVEYFQNRRMTTLLITHDYSMISRFTKAYPTIKKRIAYKELTLVGGKLRMRDFLPEEYTSWLEERKSHPSGHSKGEPIVRLESGVRIFGRTLMISRDRLNKEPAPLIVRKGTLTYLKAPSGTGKTTIVKLMMGLLQGEHMRMKLRDMMYTEKTPRRVWQSDVWGRHMTMVFQHADEALNQNERVKDLFAGLPLAPKPDDKSIVDMLSEFFDNDIDQDFLHKPVKFLSGGQKQRLNLLRSMVLDTDVIILDEPLNGLDFSSSVKVLEKIEGKLGSGKSALVISHNEEIFDALVNSENVYYLHAQ